MEYENPRNTNARFMQLQVKPDLFRIEAKGRTSVFVDMDEARAILKQRAMQVCASSDFHEMEIREHSIGVLSQGTVIAFKPIYEDLF